MTDLAELDRLYKAATPGEWKSTARRVTAPETEDRLALDVQINGGNQDDNKANARLIAALHNAYPALRAQLQADAAELARLREAVAWRPIDTCPKDGSDFLVWTHHNEVEVGRYHEHKHDVYDDAGEGLYRKREEVWAVSISDNTATHWMPFPPPPGAVA